MSNNFVPDLGAPQNMHLAALPAFDWKCVERYLSVLDKPAGKILCELDSRLDSAYFPSTSITSILQVAGDRASTEIATIGNEGLVGISLFMGVEACCCQCCRVVRREYDRLPHASADTMYATPLGEPARPPLANVELN